MSEKIKNALPPPEHCDNCGSPEVIFGTNDLLYGKQYGAWPWIYMCGDCRAAVGCHAETNDSAWPNGRFTNSVTSVEMPFCFRSIWKLGIMSRSTAYNWLANGLNIAVDDCHISWLSKDQLTVAIKLAKDYLNDNQRTAERRIARRANENQSELNATAKPDESTIKLDGPHIALIEKRIGEDIESWSVWKHADPFRRHLGASSIGNDCMRELQYTFRWAAPVKPTGTDPAAYIGSWNAASLRNRACSKSCAVSASKYGTLTRQPASNTVSEA